MNTADERHVRQDRQRERVPLLAPTVIEGFTTSPNISRATVNPPADSTAVCDTDADGS